MKQLSALGARRHFFRSPRRMRGLRGEMDEYGYFNGIFAFDIFIYAAVVPLQ